MDDALVHCPCAARQSRPVCDEPGVMTRRAGTKGLRGGSGASLWGVSSTYVPLTMMAYVMRCGRRHEVGVPWQAAMRRMVAAWESTFRRRQTDDVDTTCADERRACWAEVFGAGTMDWAGALTRL